MSYELNNIIFKENDVLYAILQNKYINNTA